MPAPGTPPCDAGSEDEQARYANKSDLQAHRTGARATASEIAYEDQIAAIREGDAEAACAAYDAMIAALRDEEDDATSRECAATFLDAADEPVCCTLPADHDGLHYDRGFTWADRRA